MDREKIIVKTSINGIIANIFLVIFKAIVGILSHSIAIVLDSINNLSDALSSVITIIGTKIAGKKPDKEHPYGHGRVEYITAMIISIIILYAGIASLDESIKKIINPEIPDYTIITIVVIVVAIIVKIFLGLYFKKVGEKVNSNSLVASGKDALMDSIISFSTLIATIIYLSLGFSIEAWIGLMISLVIIKSGIDMLKETLSQMLGKRIDRDFAIAIKNTVTSFENVYGAFDLTLNDYGPDIYLGSIHIEIPDSMTAPEIDELSRKIANKVYKEHQVIMTAIGIYSVNTQDKEVIKMREEINKIVYSFKTVIQIHGFYIHKDEKEVNFDVIIDFSDKNRDETFEKIHKELEKRFPDYEFFITLDYDLSD